VPHATPADEDEGTAPDGAVIWADDHDWDVPYGAARLGIP
jgi:hypothetical protein